MQRQAIERVRAIPGVKNVDVRMTAMVRKAPGMPSGEVLPGVKHAVAIASGKGGVGKSTVAVNLAAVLGQSGARVGLLDADIYGPSIPIMTGLTAARPTPGTGSSSRWSATASP